ncbi:MAG: Eco57I restriction-modification methylase domain-containing protein [Chroococcales cyanobacterium]
MSARHHAEWLSLVEASGPFLSLQVLLDAFPQGLDGHDPEQFALLRQVYEEWLDNAKQNPPLHRAWVEWVLGNILEFPEEVLKSGQDIPTALSVTVAEYQEVLRPDWVIIAPIDQEIPPNPPLEGGNRKPRLLVQVVPPEQDLQKPLQGSRWKASPEIRMMELLHSCDVRLGLVTNGEHWLLVHAPRGETTSYISWYCNLWLEEKLTLRAFRSLLGVRRFFAVENDETIEALFEQSKDAQQEVTDQLGFQVRTAVEVLVQALDRIDQDYNRTLLADISDKQLYESALFVMMRLVFLLSAEEKGLLLLGDDLYDQNYAISTLREQLRETADANGEEILERRYDAWCRLLATFRAVYGGVEHEALQLPAYGGNLFNPDHHPFLEGRKQGSWRNTPANPIPVNNRTVLHLLEALQVLQVSVPGGGVEPRRLSFRALDIEQIGHVYEGLLDHQAVRAETTFIGLKGTKNKEPEVSLDELEAVLAKGETEAVNYLKKQTGRSKSPLQKGLSEEIDLDTETEQGLRVACSNNEELYQRVRKFAKLIRDDTFGYPFVIPEGSVFVTAGTDRRQSGTHYTPKQLTEEIVRYTLQPLVYEGVATGKPKEEWQLKPAKELLALKVCDMAMGSGAFLVQVCRYLGERLVEAWETAESPPLVPPKSGREIKKWIVVTPEGELSQSRPDECVIPEDATERLLIAKRIIAERCVYGVDKNPLAVEMAKLSLWLETLQKNKPFTFVDHALKCGDSLLGVSLEQLRCWNLETSGKVQFDVGSDRIRREVDEAINLRLQIEGKPVLTPQDQQEKSYLLTKANARIKELKDRCDLLVGSYLTEQKANEQEALRQRLLWVAKSETDVSDSDRELLPNWEIGQPFHWELEFPEIFVGRENQGFDALVGNPPFMGSQKITGALGTPYREYIVQWLGKGKRGQADLCAYFFLRGQQLIRNQGSFGLVATNTIAQGDTREVGLDQLVKQPTLSATKTTYEGGGSIYRAVPSRKWEGSAALEVAYVWVYQGEWKGEFILDEKPVKGITPYLSQPGEAVGNPYRLAANQNQSFQGSIVLGNGFILTPEEAQGLIEKDPKNKEVLFPYLNGQDLNTNPDQSPSRWVINFFDYPLDAEHDDPKKPKGAPYAVDYPDCLAIVEEKVKPEREQNNRKVRREKRWQFGERCPKLYEAIAQRDRVLVIPETTK